MEENTTLQVLRDYLELTSLELVMGGLTHNEFLAECDDIGKTAKTIEMSNPETVQLIQEMVDATKTLTEMIIIETQNAEHN